MARPNKYQKLVEPYLKDIENMSLIMTEREIADKLGIGYSTWCRYKSEKEELREAIKGGRKQLVYDLKSALIKKALGYDYRESKTTKKMVNGEWVRETSITIKHASPDVAALNLLLKNYDRDSWANDPQMIKLREKELKLREKQIENSEW